MAQLKDWLLGVEHDKVEALYVPMYDSVTVKANDDTLMAYVAYLEARDEDIDA